MAKRKKQTKEKSSAKKKQKRRFDSGSAVVTVNAPNDHRACEKKLKRQDNHQLLERHILHFLCLQNGSRKKKNKQVTSNSIDTDASTVKSTVRGNISARSFQGALSLSFILERRKLAESDAIRTSNDTFSSSVSYLISFLSDGESQPSSFSQTTRF